MKALYVKILREGKQGRTYVCGTRACDDKNDKNRYVKGKSRKTQYLTTIQSFIAFLYHCITLEEVWPMTGLNVLPYSAVADKCFQVIINFSFSLKHCELCAGVYTQDKSSMHLLAHSISYNLIGTPKLLFKCKWLVSH